MCSCRPLVYTLICCMHCIPWMWQCYNRTVINLPFTFPCIFEYCTWSIPNCTQIIALGVIIIVLLFHIQHMTTNSRWQSHGWQGFSALTAPTPSVPSTKDTSFSASYSNGLGMQTDVAKTWLTSVGAMASYPTRCSSVKQGRYSFCYFTISLLRQWPCKFHRFQASKSRVYDMLHTYVRRG